VKTDRTPEELARDTAIFREMLKTNLCVRTGRASLPFFTEQSIDRLDLDQALDLSLALSRENLPLILIQNG